eukprot:TRINITY_DN13755_c0_g1_i1.p1 TRINITY_DN13755_c0_g1~~TRINITY_DN13755_c0_g1_i1.p1  ORF type:complete len:175 (-),score=38.30 TRINITY_DN13755_c0_g1_i1:327-851(-)
MAELLPESLAEVWPLAFVLVAHAALVVGLWKWNRDQDADSFIKAKVSLPKAKNNIATKKVAAVSAHVSHAELCAQHLPLLRLQEAKRNISAERVAAVSAHVSHDDLCAQHLPLLWLQEANHNNAMKKVAAVSAHVSAGELCAQHLPLLRLHQAAWKHDAGVGSGDCSRFAKDNS